MEQLSLLCVCRGIIDLFSLSAIDDQTGRSQQLEVMGAHPYHGGEIDHTRLTVAQQPENTQAASIPKLLKNI